MKGFYPLNFPNFQKTEKNPPLSLSVSVSGPTSKLSKGFFLSNSFSFASPPTSKTFFLCAGGEGGTREGELFEPDVLGGGGGGGGRKGEGKRGWWWVDLAKLAEKWAQKPKSGLTRLTKST